MVLKIAFSRHDFDFSGHRLPENYRILKTAAYVVLHTGTNETKKRSPWHHPTKVSLLYWRISNRAAWKA